MKIRIYVDFNSRDEDDNIFISLLGKPNENNDFKNRLVKGLLVVLYDEELEVEAQLGWSDEFNMWLGIPDWSTRKDLE